MLAIDVDNIRSKYWLYYKQNCQKAGLKGQEEKEVPKKENCDEKKEMCDTIAAANPNSDDKRK